jgi:hypothetical protein
MPLNIGWLGVGSNARDAGLCLVGAFLLALALTPLVIAWARRNGLVARPSADRWHKKPTALFGGVAIFGAAALAAALFLPDKRPFLAVGAGGVWIWAVGVWDDLRPLRPAHKFIAQIVASCGFVAAYYAAPQNQAAHGSEMLWMMPIAVIWIAGITNAFNLLDNMDGLSAGVATLVALLMAAHAAVMGDTVVVLGALLIAGASGGFLVFNFNPAKVFMGDCGSDVSGLHPGLPVADEFVVGLIGQPVHGASDSHAGSGHAAFRHHFRLDRALLARPSDLTGRARPYLAPPGDARPVGAPRGVLAVRNYAVVRRHCVVGRGDGLAARDDRRLAAFGDRALGLRRLPG